METGLIVNQWPQSSNIISTTYDPVTRALDVAFKSGTYRYKDVPIEVIGSMQQAESVGSFIARNIKANFPCEKLNPAEAAPCVSQDGN